MGLFLLLVPIISALFLIIMRGRYWQHLISVLNSTILLVLAFLLTRLVLANGKVEYAIFGGFFYIDSISMIVLDLVLAIGFVASIYIIAYLEEELKNGKIDLRKIKMFYILLDFFTFAMILALTANNMGIMWIGIETTTLASVFLVGFYNDKHDLEAAWKYVMICSVGIALALLGIILLHLSSVIGLSGSSSLNWTSLFEHAVELKTPVLKLAFIFILVGFGTKAGLSPMNTWLPDAHSQAPAPISALLSGVLLNTAMYGIIRTVAIVNKNLGSSTYTGRILIAIGLLSMVTAAVSMLTQKDYKRMLAYSSIEHMGIIAIAIGVFTPAAIFGAFLHMMNHSLTKSMLFFSSGNIYLSYHSKEIAKVRGALKRLPVSATVFFLGLFAIAGMPPFSIFASEFCILTAIFASHGLVLGALFIFILSLVFMSIALILFKMFFGNPPISEQEPREGTLPGKVMIILLLAIVSITGLYWPHWVNQLILQAQKIVMGG